MLMPARVEPTFTARAYVVGDGQRMGNGVHELDVGVRRLPCARAREKPPTKSTPTSLPALSMATAMGVRSVASVAAQISAMGVTEMRLFTMGMPYSRSSCSAVGTRLLGRAWSCGRRPCAPWRRCLASVQPRRFRPSVMVRMSRCCLLTMASVSAISAGVICMGFLSVESRSRRRVPMRSGGRRSRVGRLRRVPRLRFSDGLACRLLSERDYTGFLRLRLDMPQSGAAKTVSTAFGGMRARRQMPACATRMPSVRKRHCGHIASCRYSG